MSADQLRRAAAKLQERAEKATPGPWNADPAEVYGDHHGIWVAESLNGDLPDAGEANSLYIALMHPPVALALADWLDELAHRAEEMGSQDCGVWPDGTNHTLAIARAILREDS